jgi:hypothetical protein
MPLIRMDIKINYSEELEVEVKSQINFIREEFECLFGDKANFDETDRKIAMDLLNHLAKQIDQSAPIDILSQTLEHLEQRYSGLF